MAGFRQKVNWFSPRAIKEPTPRVVEERIGPNSFRYVAKKNAEPNTLNTPKMDQGLLYSEYVKRKEEKKNKKNNIHTFKGVTVPNRHAHVNDHWNENDYYGSDYTSAREKEYAWKPTRWSNWSYTSFLKLANDDDENMFVKSPENYLTPTVEQIKTKTNYWTHKDLKRIKELSRVCYLKMIDDPEYIAKEFEDPCNSPGMTPEEWRKTKDMYDNVYTTYVPGFTPLEQAIAINHKINDIASKEHQNKHKGRGRSRAYEFRRSDYADPTINSQLDMCPFNREYSLDILNNISLMGDLGSQFKVEREIGETEVGYSDTLKSKLMTSYDQITMINMYQRMLHGYDIRFLTKNLVVNVPVETSEKKQKIIILLDFSGSMSKTSKQIKVNAILMDRFRYVMKGEAEVYISYFVSDTGFLKFHHIKDEKDVKKFWEFHDNYPNGSYTNIGRNVEYVAKQIRGGRLHNLRVDLSKELPEILIINDGEDEVGYDKFPYKVNAISLHMMSNELKTLCIATGGKQVFIRDNGTVTAYSSKGEEDISQ